MISLKGLNFVIKLISKRLTINDLKTENTFMGLEVAIFLFFGFLGKYELHIILIPKKAKRFLSMIMFVNIKIYSQTLDFDQ